MNRELNAMEIKKKNLIVVHLHPKIQVCRSTKYYVNGLWDLQSQRSIANNKKNENKQINQSNDCSSIILSNPGGGPKLKSSNMISKMAPSSTNRAG